MITPQNVDKEEIRRVIDCSKLAIALGVRHKAGKSFHCFYPNHEDKNASMTINKDYFICGCSVQGDCFTMVQVIRGCNFKDALDYLSNYTGIEGSDEYTPSPKSPPIPIETDYSLPSVSKSKLKVMEAIGTTLYPFNQYGENFDRWCKSRALSPSKIVGFGCRDLDIVKSSIVKVLQSFSKEEQLESGFYTIKNGKLKWWVPFDMMNNSKYAGMLIPQFLPGYNFPISYRFRYYYPETTGHKVWSMFGSLSTLPLGFIGSTIQSSKRIIIAEGEPDWLSIYQESSFAERNIGVMGLTVAKWNHWYTKQIIHAEKIVLMIHRDKKEGDKGDKLSKTIYNSIKELTDKKTAQSKYQKFLFDGKDDASDYLQSGKLLERIKRGIK